MKAMISTLSLALSLAVATPAFAQTAPTAADADAFIASVEKDLFDYTVEASQVNWVNSTYLTEDTDAMASRINAVGTEKSVKYALEAAKYMNVAGLSADTKRKLDILRTGIVLPAPTHTSSPMTTIASAIGLPVASRTLPRMSRPTGGGVGAGRRPNLRPDCGTAR